MQQEMLLLLLLLYNITPCPTMGKRCSTQSWKPDNCKDHLKTSMYDQFRQILRGQTRDQFCLVTAVLVFIMMCVHVHGWILYS